MATVKLQFGDDEYRIVLEDAAGEVTEGEIVPYGESATLEANGTNYLAVCDLDGNGEDVVSSLPDEEWVVTYSPVQAETEDVKFEADGEVAPEAEVEVEENDEELG